MNKSKPTSVSALPNQPLVSTPGANVSATASETKNNYPPSPKRSVGGHGSIAPSYVRIVSRPHPAAIAAHPPIPYNPPKLVGCCCGCEIATTLTILASFEIIRGILSVVFLFVFFKCFMDLDEYHDNVEFLGVGILFGIADFCLSLGLLLGAIWNRKTWAMMTHIGGWLLCICMTSFYSLFYVRNEHTDLLTAHLVVTAFIFVFRVYQGFVVYHFIQKPKPIALQHIAVGGYERDVEIVENEK